jgi:hypothetical protein
LHAAIVPASSKALAKIPARAVILVMGLIS